MLDRTWTINFASPTAVEAGYSDDLEFFVKELGKTYLAIWQAWNIGRHVWRHYGDIFLDRCNHCRGAGTVTCHHCHGFKNKRLRSNTFSLAAMGSSRSGAVLGGDEHNAECIHCGTYCKWDNQDKWHLWTTVREVESEVMEDLFTEPEARHSYSDMEDEKQQDSRYIDPEDYVDGTGDTDFAGWYTGDENGEAHPHRLHMSEFVYNHPEYFDNPVSEAEAEAIDQNLAAGVGDRPKPFVFEPTAGTVPCPHCNGRPWYCNLIPNFDKLGGYRMPFWYTTMQRMGARSIGPLDGDNPSTRPRAYLEYPPALPARADLPLAPRDPFNYYSTIKDVGVNMVDTEEYQEHQSLLYVLQHWDEVMQTVPIEDRDQFKQDLYARLHLTQMGPANAADPVNFLSDGELLQAQYNAGPLDGQPRVKWSEGARRAARSAIEARPWEDRLVRPLEFDIQTDDMLDGVLAPREQLGKTQATLFAEAQPSDNLAFLRMLQSSNSAVRD